ncbi:histone deacetylase [bacterium]|nr:histone deacetylase [bacterium]
MPLYYTDQFVLPLPKQHRFPMQKYARLRAHLAQSSWREHIEFLIPPAATDEEILRAHTPAYLAQICEGRLSREEILGLGFPWSPELVERSRRSSGGTISACRSALSQGFSANLAGGTHHAFTDHGEGFCLFNDSMIAARAMQAEGLVTHVAIIDCDVHQGNGTASIAADDPSIFTFSIHSARNYPFQKMTSDWDIELPDGTSDETYLWHLYEALPAVIAQANPDLVIYVSGADPYVGDRLGRLALTPDGLAARDRLVYESCRHHQLPVAVSMAGGYAPNIDEIVAIHAQTVEIGIEMWSTKR